MKNLLGRGGRWVACAGLLLAFTQSCSKENNIDSHDVTVGNLCGPKIACSDGSCAFGYCRNPCEDDSDCANTGVCLSDGQTKGCRLPSEAKCSASNPCPAGLLCAEDGSCRTPCDDERICDIEGQACLEGACVDGSTAGTGGSGGSGTAGTAGSSGGKSGSGGKGGSSSGGMSGSSGSASVDGGEPNAGGQGGAGEVPVECGGLGQDCCASGSACAAGKGLMCGQDSQCVCDLGATDCDGKPANGCEANLLGDADNCGKCEHDCGGGQCAAGKCEAVLVVPASTTELWSGSWDQGSSGAFDYVNRDAAGWVGPAKEPVGGKVQLRAYAPDGTPGAFLTNEADDIPIKLGPFLSPIGIVWTESGVLKRMSRSGGAIVTVLTFSVDALRMDASSLYVLSPPGANGALHKFTQGSLTPTPLFPVTDKDAYSDVVLDGSGGLFAQCSGDFIGGCTLGALYGGSTTGNSLTLRYSAFAGAEKTSRLIATPETVFGYSSAVTKLTLAGPTRSVILPASAGLGTITHAVTDGTWVYFIASSSGLYRMSASGSTPEKLHSGVALWALSQDQDNLYFWQAGYNRIRKPAN